MPDARGFDGASADRVRDALGRWVSGQAGRRQAPKSDTAQVRYVLRDKYGGSTRKMADDYGVTQRTIQRWLKGTRAPSQAPRISGEVGNIRRRRAARKARAAVRRGQGPRVKAKGWIGPAAPPGAGGSDTRRRRTMPGEDVPPGDALDLIDAYEAGDDEALRDALGGAYGGYFNGGPGGPDADIGGIDWIEFE